MNQSRRSQLISSLAVVLLMGLSLAVDKASCAIPPVSKALPAITLGVATPVKIAADATSDNFFVTDPVAGGVLKYNRSGVQLQKIVTPKSVTGIAIALNGNLLVTQGTYVDVIDASTGLPISGKSFGVFGNATDITIDGLGNAYVADGLNNTVTKFTYGGVGTNDYASAAVIVTATYLKRPSAVAFEKSSNLLYVANALSSTIQIYTLTGGAPLKTIGSFGYVQDRAATAVRFTYPQAIAFEYDSAAKLNRIYVSDAYQGFVQVLDGTHTYTTTLTGTFFHIGDVGSYGFTNDKLFVPYGVAFDQKDPNNKRLFVANGAGSLAVYSIDATTAPTNYTLTLALNLLNGSDGQITGTVEGTVPVTVTCTSTSCPQVVVEERSTITLQASPASTSEFKGWTGACAAFNPSNLCSFVMTADTSTSASFDLKPIEPFKVGGSTFSNLQAAYDYAFDNNISEIKAMAGSRPARSNVGPMLAHSVFTVTIKGGYDDNFANQTGFTVISGGMRLRAGQVNVDHVAVGP